MDERTIGLILRTRPLTETSLIVHWLTKDFGRVHTVAKGARRPKSPFLGKLDLFYLAELSFQSSGRSELRTLREVKVLDHRRELRRELAYLQQASYFAHLLEQSTEMNTPVPGLFHLIARAVEKLTQSPPSTVTILAFELQLLVELGLSPNFDHSSLSPDVRHAMAHYTVSGTSSLPPPTLTRSQLDEMDHFLHAFLIYHLGRLPKSRQAALAVSGEGGT